MSNSKSTVYGSASYENGEVISYDIFDTLTELKTSLKKCEYAIISILKNDGLSIKTIGKIINGKYVKVS